MTTSQEMHMHACQVNAMPDKQSALVLVGFVARLKVIMSYDEDNEPVKKKVILSALEDSIKYVRTFHKTTK